MNRWLHIDFGDKGFYRIDCTKVTHVHYGGAKTLSIYTMNNQLIFEFCWENYKDDSKYKEYAEEISDFIEGGNEDGNVMLVNLAGLKNTIKVTKKDSKHSSINID